MPERNRSPEEHPEQQQGPSSTDQEPTSQAARPTFYHEDAHGDWFELRPEGSDGTEEHLKAITQAFRDALGSMDNATGTVAFPVLLRQALDDVGFFTYGAREMTLGGGPSPSDARMNIVPSDFARATMPDLFPPRSVSQRLSDAVDRFLAP